MLAWLSFAARMLKAWSWSRCVAFRLSLSEACNASIPVSTSLRCTLHARASSARTLSRGPGPKVLLQLANLATSSATALPMNHSQGVRRLSDIFIRGVGLDLLYSNHARPLSIDTPDCTPKVNVGGLGPLP